MSDPKAAARRHCAVALAIFTEHTNALRAVLYRYTRNTSDVDEHMQDVFIRLVGAKDLTLLRSNRAFVLRVAHNVALDIHRHKSITKIDYVPEITDESVPAHVHLPDIREEIEAEEELMTLLRATLQLPPLCRHVFTLKKVYGYSQKEIARHMKISENTVEQHLTKAANSLAAILDGTRDTRSSNILDMLRHRRQRGY